jgi:hypothetical protein
MKRFLVSLFTILLSASPLLHAQEGDPAFTVYGSALVPLGKYGTSIGTNAGVTRRFGFDIGEEAGLASPGFGAGVDFHLPVLTRGLAWVISLQALTNGITTDDATHLFRDDLDDSVAVAMTSGSWIHLPLMTGLSYAVSISDGIGVHVTLQAGVHVTRQASRTVTVNGLVVEETSFTFTPDFGYLAGIGISLFEDYQILVRYVNLGTPRYEGTRTLNEKFFTTIPRRENAINGDPRSVKMLVFSLGYNL